MQSDGVLRAAHLQGREAWPTIALDYDEFARRIKENDVSDSGVAEHAADLYLAAACAQGDEAAMRILDEQYIGRMDGALARAGVPRDWLGEVRQKVRVKLLMGSPPGIARYRGLGPLAGLVRVTAVRVGLDIATAAAAIKHRPDDEVLNVLVSMDASPEVETARAMYRERFRAAVEETLASLTKREKTILRLHFIEKLNIDAIGAIYRVHRGTVARWLLAIRGRALADLRKRLSLHLGGTPSELRSLMNLLHEDLELSARRILANSQA